MSAGLLLSSTTLELCSYWIMVLILISPISTISIIALIYEDFLDLIQCASFFDHQTNRTGETVLHYAVRSGEKKMVRFLIDRGINVAQAGSYSATPFSLLL